METHLHALVAAQAASDPAILIADDLLIDLITRRLRDAIAKYKGYYQQYPAETGRVQIGIVDCTYQHANAGWTISLPPMGAQTGLFVFESANAFNVRFAVTHNGDPTAGLFEIILLISKVSAVGRAGYNALSIGDVNIDFGSSIVPDPNATANAGAIGLSELELARLQGLIEGSVAPKVLKNIFSGSPSIDLRSLFPTIVFQGQAELAAIKGGLLVIARDGWQLDETQRCHCAGTVPDVITRPMPPLKVTETGGTVPLQVNIPPPRSPPWPVETAVAPDIALYLPHPSVKSITSGPYSAINDFAEDNGFIGWSYDYTIGFPDAQPSLTDPRATIVLSLEFYVTGSGKVSVDVPCIGRTTVGMLWATNRVSGPSIVEIGITPRLQADGKIVLVPELLSLQIQPFKVDCIVIALSLLSYFGPWGTLAAFVLNEVIRRVIAHNLPPKLNAGLRDAMGKQMWTLVDMAKLDINAVFGRTYRLDAAVSRNSDSLLIGLHGDPG
jgi:hypothetical protein